MARRSDIAWAFRKAVSTDPRGKRTVTTSDFVKELAKYNWHWSLKEANKWIEHYVTSFRDISTEEGDRRTFMLYNHNEWP